MRLTLPVALLDALQLRAARRRWRFRFAFGSAAFGGFWLIGGRIAFGFESHARTIFTCVDGGNVANRDRYVARDATETRLESDAVVGDR
jgi:hypothetical protein